jgi:EAL domain-containing protein (putative c-di-GMP-specific phosphodiesterase class I)
MDAAESSGLIVELGEWILREALGQLVTWQRAAGTRQLTMSVNMAARQITDEYADLVDEVLLSTGLDPDTVWLEITETAMMSDARTAEGVLHRLAGMGLHLTVDDFGTGYSSLTHLLRFPVDGIKVDRSFTEGLGQNRQADAICEGIISLARALGLKTVAEGVEHRTQLERLGELGCPLAQGYLFSRPQPPEEIAQVHGFGVAAFIPERAR